MNFPAIASDTNSTSRGIIADRIMDIGYFKAAKMARKNGMCFSLFYFAAFGRMPRKIQKPTPAPQSLTLGSTVFPLI